MFEQSEEEQTKCMIKRFLKTLPIWEGTGQFEKDFDLLKHDLSSIIQKVDKLSEGAKKLPELNVTNSPQIKPIDKSVNDLDIVKYYTRASNGDYFTKVENKKHKFKDATDHIKDESILMLEAEMKRGEQVYAMDRPGKAWVACEIMSVCRKSPDPQHKDMVTFRLKTPPGDGTDFRILNVDRYAIARIQEHGDKLGPAKRVIAGFTKSRMMPGIIGQLPSKENMNRYLVFLDDGSAAYYQTNQIYPIFGQSVNPWFDARCLRSPNDLNASYLRTYFGQYPKRNLLLIGVGEECSLFRNGVCVSAEVISIDCDTMRVLYKDNTEESVYLGSARLGKGSEILSRQLRSDRSIEHLNNNLLLYMHLYHEASKISLDRDYYNCLEGIGRTHISRNGTQVARKSTTRIISERTVTVQLDEHSVEEDRNTITTLDPNLLEQLKGHKCSPDCLVVPGMTTEISVRDIIGEFRNVSDLKVPLLLGWKRELKRVSNPRGGKSKIQIVYSAPCGKIFTQVFTIRSYIRNTNSKFDIDYFSTDRDLELNRNLEECKAYYFVENFAVDPSGKPLENKNISLLNQFSQERPPEDFEYRNQSFPHPMLAAKGFSFNPEFKSGCDCEDDCYQRSTCSCHRLNELFFGKNAHNKGGVENRCQYTHKRLPMQVSTGIFECNAFCKCSSKCGNRVVQNGIRFRLQVRKTLGKGWGVITLDDIPQGAFICTYAAELLDDADQYGDSDMYYADLDYITVNEEQKKVYSDSEDKSDEGVGDSDEDEDVDIIPNKKFNGKRKDAPRIKESDSSEGSVNNDHDARSSAEKEVDMNGQRSRYPKRKQVKMRDETRAESLRAKQFRRIHDILGSHDYTLDARMQGNVGRFFNHGCDPNAYVQNVFIDTHDLRFPNVAFFATRRIKALEEITWNYNYCMGSIIGRRIDCKCGASNCRGRIL